ncbi:MAG: hypothetical protein AAF704_05945 [Cyanobacteria bacterium P01_D01_bin.123]
MTVSPSEPQPTASAYVDRVEALFERGDYRGTLSLVAEALESYPESTALRLWQAIATDASGDTESAIALVRPLTQMGDRETRTQASYLLRIWQAPRLARPQTWMTDVPTVTAASDRATVIRAKVATGKVPNSETKSSEFSAGLPEELTQEPTESELPEWWLAIGAIAVILLGMVTFSYLTQAY